MPEQESDVSTANLAYLIAAAFMLRWGITAKDAAGRAADLWREIADRL